MNIDRNPFSIKVGVLLDDTINLCKDRFVIFSLKQIKNISS